MMLTHRWSAGIAEHFARLRSEAGRVLPAYLALSLAEDDAPLPEGCSPDIIIRPSDSARWLPTRADYARRSGVWTGSSDRFSVPAFLGPLAAFERVWLVEYDVDYAGDWGDFFRGVESQSGDYVATHIRHRVDDPYWPHWETFVAAGGAQPASQIASFHPIACFSRRMIEAHVRAVEIEGWVGHTEAIYPSVAHHLGLHLVDLGGAGPFVPEGWSGRHYEAAERADQLSSSFGYRPPVSCRYFHEAPERFQLAGRLYHPVKLANAAGPPDLLMDLPTDWQRQRASSPTVPAAPLRLPADAATARRPLTMPGKICRELRRLARQIGSLRNR